MRSIRRTAARSWMAIQDRASLTRPRQISKCSEGEDEDLWQFLRGNWLGNRIFQSYADILNHCCDAWTKLIAQPWRIMSIGLRPWAHGF